MRLALALAVLVVAAGQAEARSNICVARVHKGATPYVDEGSATVAPVPADTSHGSHGSGPDDAEVASIDHDNHGQEWVYRVHEFAWKRQDVDLRGDCRRARS